MPPSDWLHLNQDRMKCRTKMPQPLRTSHSPCTFGSNDDAPVYLWSASRLSEAQAWPQGVTPSIFVWGCEATCRATHWHYQIYGSAPRSVTRFGYTTRCLCTHVVVHKVVPVSQQNTDRHPGPRTLPLQLNFSRRNIAWTEQEVKAFRSPHLTDIAFCRNLNRFILSKNTIKNLEYEYIFFNLWNLFMVRNRKCISFLGAK